MAVGKHASQQSGHGDDRCGRWFLGHLWLRDRGICVESKPGEQQVVVSAGRRGTAEGAIQHEIVDRRLRSQGFVAKVERAVISAAIDSLSEFLQPGLDLRTAPATLSLPLHEHELCGGDQVAVDTLSSGEFSVNPQRFLGCDCALLRRRLSPRPDESIDPRGGSAACEHDDLLCGIGALELLRIELGIGKRFAMRGGQQLDECAHGRRRRVIQLRQRQTAPTHAREQRLRSGIQRLQHGAEIGKDLSPYAGCVDGSGFDLRIETFCIDRALVVRCNRGLFVSYGR
ncbi:MAG: hypothetical protein F4Y11_09790, partial [Chloroflexi bacterium]|nr:hypothetical protein [Chloroflexota bacterium]